MTLDGSVQSDALVAGSIDNLAGSVEPAVADGIQAGVLAAAAVPQSAIPLADVVAPGSLLVDAMAAPAPQLGATAATPTADSVLEGAQARSLYGVDGTGIKIGIISDSFDMLGSGPDAASDEATGTLPPAADVHILQDAYDGASTSDEGRAMAQVTHSIAPGAQIYFYSVGGSESDFAHAITALQQAGCQIIIDDEFFFAEPFYQTGGVIDNAIDAATAAGVTYFTAAGNVGADYVEATFSPISVTLPSGLSGALETAMAHNFGVAGHPTPYEQLVIPGGDKVEIDLQWAQPFASIGNGSGAASNLAILLFRDDPSGPTLVASGNHNVLGDDPFQFIQYTAPADSTSAYEFAIIDDAGTTAGLFKVMVFDKEDRAEILGADIGTGSGSVFGHALDPNAIAVGATPVFDPGQPEDYSSLGPGELYFDSDGNPLATPGSAGKPDITAPDGSLTTVSDIGDFFGTSAATPAAAAVGALMLQANPSLDPSDISILMTAAATPYTDMAENGAGLLNADLAVGMAKTLRIQAPAYTSTVEGTHLDDTIVGAAGDHTIDGGAGINTLDYSGAAQGVQVNIAGGMSANGYGGYDTFTNIQDVDGSAFDDTFGAAPGSHVVNGGGGHDTLVFGGDAADYTITQSGSTVTIADSIAWRDGTMSTNGVEILQFADRTIFVESQAHADLAALYTAALGRAPDIPGLEGWEDLYDTGLTPAQKGGSAFAALAEAVPAGLFSTIAAGFTQSTEFQQKYGDLTDSGFVAQLYENVLGRAPDQAGLQGWLDAMAVGDSSGQIYTRDMVLVGIADSPENLANLQTQWLRVVPG